MPRARNGSVEIEYETFGDERSQSILLVNGLGSQMTRWPVPFCEKLVAEGYRVIRFDNRDAGLSSWPAEPYTLSDMGRDAMAVLEAAGVHRAHIVGLSMGGTLVQRIAIDHPDRVLSMTSVMAGPGAPGTLVSTPEALAVLDVAPPDPAADFEAYVAQTVANARIIGSPAYPTTDEALRDRAIAEHRRAYNPAGAARQRAAVRADGDRTAALGKLTIPTVVLHGLEDPLVDPIGAIATADAIPGADLRIVPGMGHDMPLALYDTFVDAILSAAGRATR